MSSTVDSNSGTPTTDKERDFQAVLFRLCQISRNAYQNPHTAIEWPEAVLPEDWCMSPELVSLYGTPAWDALDEPAQKRLAFFEAINFFSLNINGEKALIEGLSKHLYSRERPEISDYIHHFVDEENKHMFYFGTFCRKYAGKTYPDKKLVVPAAAASACEAAFLFFLKVMIFEELVDLYNVRMSKDERLVPVARRINLLHHLDETRHLAFGRMIVSELWMELLPTLSQGRIAEIRDYATTYLESTWREYYNPDVYRDAGIPDAYRVYQSALASDATREHRKRISDKCVRYLTDIGVLGEAKAP